MIKPFSSPISTLLVFLSFCSIAMAQITPQASAPSATPNDPILKPSLTIGDLTNALSILSRVEIRGTEVDDFLVIRNTVALKVEELKKSSKKDDEATTIEIPFQVANALVLIMQRATLKGVEVDPYQSIVNSLRKAAAEIGQAPAQSPNGSAVMGGSNPTQNQTASAKN